LVTRPVKDEAKLSLSFRANSSSVGAWTISELGSFYVEHRSEFHAHALRVLRDSTRAEEVVQEALLKVLLAAPELQTLDHALGYMHRTIENLCMDIFRREGRRPNLVLIDEVSAELESKYQDSGDYADVISASEDAAIVRQALAMLSASERAALVMWEMEGRSTKEIARELGIKESSVRHTVSRARASLRRVLSEMIIDQDRGVTALDLLSTSYRKASSLAKKSSKVALSVFLALFAFLAFDNESTNKLVEVTPVEDSSVSVQDSFSPVEGQIEGKVEAKPIATKASAKAITSSANIRTSDLKFPGLDSSGVPTGFTVSDSSGSLGTAYFTERPTVATETEFTIGQIIKTESGAANIFLTQTLTTDSSGLNFRPMVSFGQSGSWVPVLAKVKSTDMSRTISGNYLFTAYIGVESALETSIKIAATANGRDLAVAPRQVITRMVLDPSKTRVLAQAIYVVEKGAKV